MAARTNSNQEDFFQNTTNINEQNNAESITQKLEIPTRVTSIAYDWCLAPLEEDNFDYILSIAVVQDDKDIYSDCFWGKFPEDKQIIEFSDVSGTLGLLWGCDNSKNDDNAAIFERTISDLIMSSISKIDIDNNRNELICIQGPMIPKLRGRIMYHDFADNIYIFAFTYQNEWLRRISKTITPYEDGDTPPSQNNFFPPLDIDHTSRSWFYDKLLYGNDFHIELISNNWDVTAEKIGEQESWLQKGIGFIGETFKSSTKKIKGWENLPTFFAKAKETSNNLIQICNRQLPVLQLFKQVNHDIEKDRPDFEASSSSSFGKAYGLENSDIQFIFDKQTHDDYMSIMEFPINSNSKEFKAASDKYKGTIAYRQYYSKLCSYLKSKSQIK